MSENRRFFSNFFPQFKAQTRYALLNVGVTLIFVTIGQILLVQKISDASVEAMQVTEEMHGDWVTSLLQYTTTSSLLISVVTIIVSYLFTIGLTFRFYGPLVAIRRQVDKLIEGNYSDRVKLRQYDEMQDLATSLNKLADKLSGKA